tara:strand:- start:66 stop:515 length:450 start_codon:yes stop_codon:yes gene_type:complete
MATLTVTHKENLDLEGNQYGSSLTFSITSINEAFKRKVTCVNGHPTTIAVFATEARTSDGALKKADAKYIRITNLHATEAVEVAFVAEATLYQVTLAGKQSHVLGAADNLILSEADTSPSFGTMTDLEKITVQPVGSETVDIELFVASS